MPKAIRRREPMTRWNVYIPVDIAAEVERTFANPVTGDITYGIRSQIVTALLREWLVKNGSSIPTQESKP